ncbi:unnamed protein product [Agarophyton chilense]
MDGADSKQEARRQEIAKERQLRFAQSLRRLLSHPFVDPRAPHGPHGRPPSPPSDKSDCTQNSFGLEKSCITWAVFNNLVTEQLGIHPQSAADESEPPAAFHRYLSNARAVSSKPSLTENAFLRRLSTGYDTAVLRDREKLRQVATDPLRPPCDLYGANAVHERVQRLKKQRRAVEKNLRTAKRARTLSTSPGSPSHALRNTSSQSPEQLGAPPYRVTRSAAKKLELGRSASQCCFCPDLTAFDGKELESELIGPFVDRRGHARLFVHFECACWAPQVYADAASGQLRRVYDEHCRGRQLKCVHCGDRGATIGCYVQRCKKVYHLRCLRISGAYTVDRFFAAFCLNHGHLGKEQSYITLMEAATIADVSAARRRDDTTVGLDAPHSQFTLLRRKETEVIFSRRWKICSHTAVFDNTKVLFSHKRRRIVSRRDKLCVADRVKALRASAIDIASGRLAYLTVLGEDAPKDDAATFQVRAALASRDVPSLLLLRNLRGAPEWDKEDIHIVKKLVPPVDRNQTPASASKDQKTELDPPDRSRRDKRVLEPDTEEKDIEQLERSPKRTRRGSQKSSGEGCVAEVEVIQSIPLQSARLPPIIRKENNSEGRGLSEITSSLPPAPEGDQSNKGDARHVTEPPSGGDQDFQSLASQNVHRKLPDPAQKHPEENQNRKIKSAWEVFVDCQLPKERMLRPDDSMEDAMRNMARLWSLMTVMERDEYEQLAQRQLQMGKQREGIQSQDHSGQRQSSSRVKGKYNLSHMSNVTNAGLFVKSNVSASNVNNGSLSSVPHGNPSDKQESRSLPSISRHSITRTGSQHMDWDELFPTSLRGIFPGKILHGSNGSRIVPRVRPPPGHGKSVT